MLEQLAYVDGPKSLILISEGLAPSKTPTICVDSFSWPAAARTSINVMLVDLQRGDVTIAEQPPTEAEDRRILMQGLEALATMSRGSLFHIAGTGEPIFERLASEISAYYLLGVEQRPSDSKGDRHRIDVEVRRHDVTIRSRQAFVLSPTMHGKRSAEENLRDALSSPFADLRSAAARDDVRAAGSGQSESPSHGRGAGRRGRAPSPAPSPSATSSSTMQNQIAGTLRRPGRRCRPAREVRTSRSSSSAASSLDPGIYSLRFGVVDAEGRRGSVVRDVNAWKMAGESLAHGRSDRRQPARVGTGTPRSKSSRTSSTDRLAAYLELYSTREQTWNGTTVTFEIADNPGLAAARVAAGAARARAGSRRGAWRPA